MYLRLLIILSLAMSAIGLGTLGWQLLAPPPPAGLAAPAAPPPPPARQRLLDAARPRLAGTLLKESDFTTRDAMPAEAPDGFLPPGDDLRGALLRRYLEAGGVMLQGDVLRPRENGFLAAVLRPGTRAFALGVDVVTGAAGLIWPGDQVDLILTQELAANEAPLARRVVGETVLNDVRVVAVDQQITRGATVEDAASGRIARTVTLELTAEQAERVAVATRLGRISLAVRAMEREPGAAPPAGGTIFGADVSAALSRAGLSQGARMRVIQGDDMQNVSFP